MQQQASSPSWSRSSVAAHQQQPSPNAGVSSNGGSTGHVPLSFLQGAGGSGGNLHGRAVDQHAPSPAMAHFRLQLNEEEVKLVMRRREERAREEKEEEELMRHQQLASDAININNNNNRAQ